MSKTVWEGGALVAPVPPVMVTCGDMENSNIITVAWTGVVNTKPPMTYISLRPQRHSYGIIKESGEFAINLTPAALIEKADYCGIYTGAKVDKFEKCGFTKAAASKISVPLIEQCPLALECRVNRIIPLGTHDMFLADIVAVDVDESIIDKNGKLRLDLAKLAAFAHGEYYELGKRIGTFGFSVKSRRSNNKKGGKS